MADWQKRAQDATRELSELRAALEAHATRWDAQAREHIDYYNRLTDPNKGHYENGKAVVYDALATEVRTLLDSDPAEKEGQE